MMLREKLAVALCTVRRMQGELVFLEPLQEQEQAALAALPCVLRLQGGVLSITQRTTCGAQGAR